MIGLLPIGRVIAVISAFYAAAIFLIAAIIWQFSAHPQTTWTVVKLAFTGATILQFSLMAWFYLGWRTVWRRFPALNRLLFPDIAGVWKIKINWQGLGQNGVVHAEATIKQDFLRISMEVRSPDSDSQTLLALPKRDPESGVSLLFYIYLVVPKAIGSNPRSPYYGSAMLRFSDADGGSLGVRRTPFCERLCAVVTSLRVA
jgi:hypothetical protein